MTKPSPRLGTIVTFYSYKGGVGRTMALANVAVVLAKWGYRVLCVDWDLEAPGLEIYFKNLSMQKRAQSGLCEAVLDVAEGKEPDLGGRVSSFTIKTEHRSPSHRAAPIDLIPAGRRDADYVERVQSIDWSSLYDDHDFGYVLERLRDRWKSDYDFILIDSRTGITDVGGICTTQLPDIVVLLFAANDQGLDGIKDVADFIDVTRRSLLVDRSQILMLPVLTKFCAGEEVDLAKKWSEKWRDTLGHIFRRFVAKGTNLDAFLDHVRIPHIPKWGFGEPLPVLSERDDDHATISFAFANIAALIARRLANTELLVKNRGDYIASAHKKSDLSPTAADRKHRRLIFISYARPDRKYADLIASHCRSIAPKSELEIFVDHSEIKPGDVWERAIDENVRTCDIFVALISADYFASDWCMREYGEAAMRAERGEVRIAPIRARPVEIGGQSLRKWQLVIEQPLSKHLDLDEAGSDVARRLAEFMANLAGSAHVTKTITRRSIPPTENSASDRRIVVVADPEVISNQRLSLEVLALRAPDGCRVVVPQLNASTFEFSRHFVSTMREASEIVFLVGPTSSSGALQLGCALTSGKCVRAAVGHTLEPADLAPTLWGRFCDRTVAGFVALRELVEDAPKPAMAVPSIKGGDGILVLCDTTEVELALSAMQDADNQQLRQFRLDAIERDDFGLEAFQGIKSVVCVLSKTPTLIHAGDTFYEGADETEVQPRCFFVLGMAVGLGLAVEIWTNDVDLEPGIDLPRRTWSSIDDLLNAFRKLDGRPLDALAGYRRHVAKVHSELIPFFGGTSEKSLADVYVELNVRRELEDGAGDDPIDPTELPNHNDLPAALARHFSGQGAIGNQFERKFFAGHMPWTMMKLLRYAPTVDGVSCRRWVVLGEPGAGKSTLLRHLTHVLADDATGPIPIFVPLARFAGDSKDPFAWAQADVSRFADGPIDSPFADSLRESAQAGNVWFFFDGLDEVPGNLVPKVKLDIARFVDQNPACRFVITSRSAGYQVVGHGFRELRLQPLSPDGRKTLLLNWLPSRGEEIWAKLQQTKTLFDIAQNPLILTLIAKLAEESANLPATRVQLYAASVDLLLKRGAGLFPKPVKAPTSALMPLAKLSLRLHETRRESWTAEQAIQSMTELATEDADVKNAVASNWSGTEDFVRDIADQSGILAAHDGPGEPWRYLHRSLREYLAAQALAAGSPSRWIEIAKSMTEAVEKDDEKRSESIQHWGETFALMVGAPLTPPQRRQILTQLAAANREVASRALKAAESVKPAEAFELLEGLADWNGDELAELTDVWRSGGVATEDITTLLWKRVVPKRSIIELAYLHYALGKLGPLPDRERFFKSCDLWPKSGFPKVEAIRVPPGPAAYGEFLMGSPEGEDGRFEREGPQHPVRISSFFLGTTVVTEAEYAVFDKTRESQRPDMPVVNVSWWEAYIFAQWMGGRLPTEAEWEFACRAGTTTRFWSGDSDEDLERVGWYARNGKHRVQPVAKKDANPFGLFDMHGNVWEWCADRFGAYTADPSTDPTGPATGEIRVMRGGSAWNVARWARSAFRVMGWPANRNVSQGFRVAFPASGD